MERAFRRRGVWSGRVTDAPPRPRAGRQERERGSARLSGIEEFARRAAAHPSHRSAKR